MIKGILTEEKLIFHSQKDDNTFYPLAKPGKILFFKAKIKIIFPEFHDLYIKQFQAKEAIQ